MVEYNFKLFNEFYHQFSTANIIKDAIELCQPNELFVQAIYQNILVPRYLISSFGRMWDTSRELFSAQSGDKDGYLRVNIRHPITNEMKTVKVHRLQLMSFKPLSDPNLYQTMEVNHINGVKQCNQIENLEWVTGLENTRHAWNTGLTNLTGENHPGSVYSDMQIHEMCKMIDYGYSNSDICDHYGLTNVKDRMRLMATLSGIRYGRTHIAISSQYNFMKGYNRRLQPGEVFLHELCVFLSDGNTYTIPQLAHIMSIPQKDLIAFTNLVYAIVDGKTGLEISRQYSGLKLPKRT